MPQGSKGAVGHDNVTFEGGFVIFVCQVPWSPGKVPSTPAVLRCPSARWIAPFSAGVAPFFPKSYAHLRMVTPFTEGVTPFADGLRSFPRDFQGLRRPTPLPRVGGSFAMHVGSARRGDEYVFFFACIIASSASCSRCVFAWFTALRAGPDLLSSIGGGCRRKPPSDKAFRRGLHRLT